MKIRVLKLGTVCKDVATELTGTLTHWYLNMAKTVEYLLQPKELNPDDGQPVKRLILEAERLQVIEDDFEEVEVPFDILGSIVTSKSSGFTGTAVCFVRHMNGCFHVSIQPKGLLPKTKCPIKPAEFDLRDCEGEKIPMLTPLEKKKSEADHPSPMDTDHIGRIHQTSSVLDC